MLKHWPTKCDYLNAYVVSENMAWVWHMVAINYANQSIENELTNRKKQCRNSLSPPNNQTQLATSSGRRLRHRTHRTHRQQSTLQYAYFP